MNSHLEIIQLILAYTLTGAVIFTVVTTCASLVGWIKFADPKQQNKLFYLLVVELVTVAVGFYSQILKFDPAQVRENIAMQATKEVLEAPTEDQKNIALIRLFWKPGDKPDPSRYAVLQQWLTAHGLDSESLTLFIYSVETASARAQMVRDLGLDVRTQF